MEERIRDAGGCSNFVAKIAYPDNNTQIPSHYSYSCIINGKAFVIDFDNNADSSIDDSFDSQKSNNKNEIIEGDYDEKDIVDKKIKIIALDKVQEYIIIKNISPIAINLKGWRIVSVKGHQTYIFGDFTLDANSTAKVGDITRNQDIDLVWFENDYIWNNRESDPAEIYNSDFQLVDRFSN